MQKLAKVKGPVAVLAALFLPGLILTALDLQAAAGVTILGSMSGLMTVALVGWRQALIGSAGLGVSTFLAVLASDKPWWAVVVMGGTALACGLMERQGVAMPIAMFGIATAFALSIPPQFAGSQLHGALLTGAAFLIAAAVATGLGWLVSRKLPKRIHTESWSRTLAYAISIAILTGVAAYFVVDRQMQHAGAWMILTILVVYQPYLQEGIPKAVQRAAGTLLGYLIALGIATLGFSAMQLTLIALLSFLLAAALQMTSQPYWQFAGVLTIGIVLIEGSSGDIVATADQRFLATMLGAAASLLLMLLLVPAYRAEQKKYGLDRY